MGLYVWALNTRTSVLTRDREGRYGEKRRGQVHMEAEIAVM